jgi:hypothetical protein
MSILRVGSLVAFKPGSQPWKEGLRRGHIVSLDTPLLVAADRIDQHCRSCGRAATMVQDLVNLGCPPDLCLPLVRCVSPICPSGWEYPCHPADLEIIEGDGLN